jgi:hypothetical protein
MEKTNLHAGWGEGSELLLHTVGDTGEHGGSTGEDDVAVEVTADIEITLEDGVVAVAVGRQYPYRRLWLRPNSRGLVNTGGFESKESRLEESFRGTETLVADSDDLTIRQLVALLQRRRLRSSLQLLLKV